VVESIVGLEKVSGTFSILLWLIFRPVLEKVPDTLISGSLSLWSRDPRKSFNRVLFLSVFFRGFRDHDA
jgi:hypothetical protein